MANVALGVILTQLIENGAGSTILLDPAPLALALISAGLILVPAVVVRRNAPSRKRTRQQTLGLILLLCGIALSAAAVYAQMAQGLPLWELPRHPRALPALAVLATGLGLTIIEGLRPRFARRKARPETGRAAATIALAGPSTGGGRVSIHRLDLPRRRGDAVADPGTSMTSTS